MNPGMREASMFREWFDVAPDAMIAVDAGGMIVRANPQAVQMFGHALDVLHGASIELLIPERVRAVHGRHVAEYAQSPRIRPMGSGQELVGLRRDGSEFPVEVALSPIHTPDGPLYVASIRDISESQRARLALVRARYDRMMIRVGQLMLGASSLEAVLGDVPELICDALDMAAVAFAFQGASHERMRVHAAHGLPHGLLDDVLAVLPVDAGVPSTVLDLTAQAAAQGGAWQALANTGFAEMAVVPLPGAEPAAGLLLVLSPMARGFNHDIRYALQSLAMTLASAMRRMRSEERLSHAQRLEAIGQLTGGIAHDFNNLLTVISGNLQILEEEIGDDTPWRDIIQSAMRAVGRGSDLTRKLLAFARRQQLSPQRCELDVLLGDLGAMLRRTLGDAIDLQTYCPDGLPAVFVDPGQLDAALVNLAINARDAMPRGGRLNISAGLRHELAPESTDASGVHDYVVLTVRDTGLGMSPDVLARALEPFYTTKDHGKGTGLGLSMVYGFVKQSGGHLSIDSRLGYGTCVELHLPAIRGSAAVPEPRVTTESASARNKATVLVVEDETDVRQVALRFVQSMGHVTLAAANADEALVLLNGPQGGAVDLVFSDVMLGNGMNGVELAREVHRLRPGLPVLLTSGDERSLQERGDATGFDFLRKPYRREALSAALRKLLDAR
ncbi:PAS domain S-box protein [Dyella sp. A6]|uniref:PAS domain S-box protein n=1 Tax=Dyella aluminiiresistens TaxID=3069105 RepID=UPI002E769157|nr:PAS domain S-box protein [Dyella sp. A6]